MRPKRIRFKREINLHGILTFPPSWEADSPESTKAWDVDIDLDAFVKIRHLKTGDLYYVPMCHVDSLCMPPDPVPVLTSSIAMVTDESKPPADKPAPAKTPTKKK